MRFLYPELLWLLALIPLLVVLKGRRGQAPSLIFSSTSVAGVLAEARRISPGRFGSLAKALVLIFLVFALARPQEGETTTEIKASGIDIMLAVDVSSSMEAMDFTLGGQSVNRLEVVKNVVAKFIAARPNDRIGLVAFAGKPYLISPLTLDHDWLKKRLESLKIGMMEDGTAIGSAIGTSVNRLREQTAKSRIIILLTDGVNNSGRIPPRIAADAAEALQIKVYTIGAGTRGLAPYPVTQHGKRRLVKARVDIDEKTLRSVADRTGALYFRATDTRSLEQIYNEINTMETTTRTIKKFENYRELFPIFLAAALLSLTFALYLNNKRLP